jgi:hypothetical protein
MAEPARMVTTDAEIDAAIEAARQTEKFDRRVVRASDSRNMDSVVLVLENGVTHSIPRRLLQGLREARPEDLKEIELLGRGTGLYWPALDVAHLVSGLLAGVYGSARWMKELNLWAEPGRISA